MQYLYIIKCQEFHKIGIANDVDTRLSQLSTGNPYPLDVVSIYGFANAETVERALHQRYSDVRVRGEWFGLDDHDISNIEHVCKMLGGKLIETVAEVTDDKLEEAEHDYVLTGNSVWRLEARNDRSPAGYAVFRRGKQKEYLGYVRGCDLKDAKRPTIEEIDSILLLAMEAK